MGDVIVNFLQPLARQFTMPKGAATDPEAWQFDYVDALEKYTDSLLSQAARQIIRSRDSRTFPLVAECVRACHDLLETFAQPDLQKPIEDKHNPEWSDNRRHLADRLFACEMGREAVKDGWGWALWDWLRVHGRHPDRYEAEEIRTKGMANSKRFWDAISNPPPIINTTAGVDVKKYITFHNNVQQKLRRIVQIP